VFAGAGADAGLGRSQQLLVFPEKQIGKTDAAGIGVVNEKGGIEGVQPRRRLPFRLAVGDDPSARPDRVNETSGPAFIGNTAIPDRARRPSTAWRPGGAE
jgi:hypothetical protein